MTTNQYFLYFVKWNKPYWQREFRPIIGKLIETKREKQIYYKYKGKKVVICGYSNHARYGGSKYLTLQISNGKEKKFYIKDDDIWDLKIIGQIFQKQTKHGMIDEYIIPKELINFNH